MPNYDEETGIRYGVISPHSISSWMIEKIYSNGDDPYYEYARKEIIDDLKEFCEDHNIDFDRVDSDQFVDLVFENVENPDGAMDYSDKEYTLHVSGDNFGIFVMKSPYYTYCRACSPCAPGTGDLDSPLDPTVHKILENYHKTLCLGKEWFDEDNPCPYKVYRVDDGTEVI
jgi:hypothetical protein